MTNTGPVVDEVRPIPGGGKGREFWKDSGLLLVLMALSQGLFIKSLGFYNDSWFLAWFAKLSGGAGLIEALSSDRPVAGYSYALIHSVANLNPFVWQLAIFFAGLLAGVCLLWSLRQLWPAERLATLGAACLFVLYPGFSQRVDPQYWQQLSALAWMNLSLAASLAGLAAASPWKRYALCLLAVTAALLSWLTNEMFLFMEPLRWAFFFLWAWNHRTGAGFRPLWGPWAKRYAPYLFGVAAFLVWRMVIFSNPRHGQDIGKWLGSPLDSPEKWVDKRLIDLGKDFIDVTMNAWVYPLFAKFMDADPLGLFVALVVGLIGMLLFLAHTQRVEAGASPAVAGPYVTARDWAWPAILTASVGGGVLMSSWLYPGPGWKIHLAQILPAMGLVACLAHLAARQALAPRGRGFLAPDQWPWHWIIIGGLAALAGILVTNLTGRSLSLNDVRDRWITSAIFGGVMFVMGLVGMIPHRALAKWVVAGLIGVSLVFNVCAANEYRKGWDYQRRFIWQLHWRAPRLPPSSLVLADVGQWPKTPRPYEFLGLFSFIYPYGLSGQVGGYHLRNRNKFMPILQRDGESRMGVRSYSFPVDPKKTLLVSMPDREACLTVLDPKRFVAPQRGDRALADLARFSRPEIIEDDPHAAAPPVEVFGPPPPCDWCYYYQKASLARQFGRWADIVKLYKEARSKGLTARDAGELLPFIEGLARGGEMEQAKKLAAQAMVLMPAGAMAQAILQGVGQDGGTSSGKP